MPEEPKAWGIQTVLLGALGGLTLVLLSLGYYSITGQIRDGDAVTHSVLTELKAQNLTFGTQMLEITKQVAVLQANQNTRLKREEVEMQRGTRDILGNPIKGKGNKGNQDAM